MVHYNYIATLQWAWPTQEHVRYSYQTTNQKIICLALPQKLPYELVQETDPARVPNLEQLVRHSDSAWSRTIMWGEKEMEHIQITCLEIRRILKHYGHKCMFIWLQFC